MKAGRKYNYDGGGVRYMWAKVWFRNSSVFEVKKVWKPPRKEQGCKRQAIQSLRSSSMRTNRVETPGGCLCANDDIRPVFGRDRWAYGAKERNIKSAGVPSCVSAREGCLRCCFRACVACGFVCDDTEG